jgi:hypothetical protein
MPKVLVAEFHTDGGALIMNAQAALLINELDRKRKMTLRSA